MLFWGTGDEKDRGVGWDVIMGVRHRKVSNTSRRGLVRYLAKAC